MKHVIVTGGAGYIGSHACKALARRGYLPITIDNLSQGHREAVKWGPLERFDLLEPGLADLIAYYAPVAVLHFAALAYPGQSVQDPAIFYRNNVAGTLNLLDAMRTAGVQNLVFSSSCAVYGEAESLTLDENSPIAPVSPYGHTKAMCERMILGYGRAYGLKSVILRYFNAAGADPDGDIGEDHIPEPHLIPNLLKAAAGEATFEIHGTHYPTPDGTCIRDYVHVQDLARAHFLALDHLLAKRTGGIFNLGSGRGYSVLEAKKAAERVTGKTISALQCRARPGDPSYMWSDSQLARAVLGWQSEISDIDTILATAWAWHQKKAAP